MSIADHDKDPRAGTKVATKQVAKKKPGKKKASAKKVAKKKVVTKKIAQKKVVKKTAGKKTAARKQAVARKTAATKRASTSSISYAEYRERVATAAYFIAEKRLFENGLPHEDWVQAEREVKATLEKAGITID